MIVHVAKRCLYASSLSDVFVATDSKEIEEVILEWGGKVIMTSSCHQSGTDRIAEAALSIDSENSTTMLSESQLIFQSQSSHTITLSMPSLLKCSDLARYPESAPSARPDCTGGVRLSSTSKMIDRLVSHSPKCSKWFIRRHLSTSNFCIG